MTEHQTLRVVLVGGPYHGRRMCVVEKKSNQVIYMPHPVPMKLNMQENDPVSPPPPHIVYTRTDQRIGHLVVFDSNLPIPTGSDRSDPMNTAQQPTPAAVIAALVAACEAGMEAIGGDCDVPECMQCAAFQKLDAAISLARAAPVPENADQQIFRDVYDEVFEFLRGAISRKDSIESQATNLTGRILKHLSLPSCHAKDLT